MMNMVVSIQLNAFSYGDSHYHIDRKAIIMFIMAITYLKAHQFQVNRNYLVFACSAIVVVKNVYS